MSTTDQIRAALRTYEQREGISQNEHARRLGVPVSSMSDFLNGEIGPGPKMLKAIRKYHPEFLHLILTWLADETEADTATPSPRR